MHMHSKASDIVIDETDTSVDKITAKLDTIFENDNDLKWTFLTTFTNLDVLKDRL